MADPGNRVRIAATDCLTPFGDAAATLAALLRGERALKRVPVLGREGGDLVPLALIEGRALDESEPPEWLSPLSRLARSIPGEGWGSARRPIFVTGSNFGVGALYAYRRSLAAVTQGTASAAGLEPPKEDFLKWGDPGACVARLAREFGWGSQVTVFSHACVSAHLGLLQATRALEAGLADEALVFTFDFLSPFVAGGFHALKILNGEWPAPYENRPTGAIGLGDGAAYAVLGKGKGDLCLAAQNLHNEMYHVTGNRPDGSGFAACLEPIVAAAKGRRVWMKGHGTGTLEAGRLEAGALAQAFGEAPLVGWKGSLGHTLGSCGVVELSLAAQAIRVGRTPGTVGSRAPALAGAVAFDAFDNRSFDAVVCASNAFGGSHAAFLLAHA